MAGIKSFRDLDTWKVAMKFAEEVYTVSAKFPDSERFGLTFQIRKAAVSVPSNVAEGQATGGIRWSLRYIRTAIGSLAEADTQLELALRLRYVQRNACETLLGTIEDARRLLYGMRRERMRRLGRNGAAVVLLLVLFAHASLY